MNKIKELFITHCGDKYEKFVDKLYANDKGEIELWFWQEKLINSFIEQHQELSFTENDILNLVRDGSEHVYDCPVNDCWGHVSCLERQDDIWGCGECGTIWNEQKLLQDIENL